MAGESTCKVVSLDCIDPVNVFQRNYKQELSKIGTQKGEKSVKCMFTICISNLDFLFIHEKMRKKKTKISRHVI